MGEKVFVAMSGGVDSTVAAYLLKEQGFDVAGVTMRVWDGGAENNAEQEASAAAKALDIPHYSFDLRQDFEKLVIKPFIGEYLNGRTPNPCVLCNKSIKWGKLIDRTLGLKGGFAATGHYANVISLNGRLSLKKASEKDQTYVLYGLSQQQLAKTLFPLGKLAKDEVRRIAGEAGLSVSEKPDSQDICFISDNNHAHFIEKYTGKREEQGSFVLEDGTVLGFHGGISKYTIGQRKGLGISYSEPLYVQRLIPSENLVVLGKEEGLFSKEFTVANVNYMGLPELSDSLECIAKIRYAHKGAKCVIETVKGFQDKLHCVFREPQRAITPGQAAVFYNEEGAILAGGIIE